MHNIGMLIVMWPTVSRACCDLARVTGTVPVLPYRRYRYVYGMVPSPPAGSAIQLKTLAITLTLGCTIHGLGLPLISDTSGGLHPSSVGMHAYVGALILYPVPTYPCKTGAGNPPSN